MADNQPDTLPAFWDGQETGTVADTTRLFAGWSGGLVFDYGQPGPTDIDTMLRQDGRARAVESVLTLPLRGATHNFKAADGDTGELEFIQDAFSRPANVGGMTTSLELVLAQMTAACVYRKVYFEKVFDVGDDGKVRYQKVEWRPPHTCQVVRKNDGSFDGFKQWRRQLDGSKADWVPIPAGRAFVYFYGQHRDPVSGISDMDVCYTAWSTKQKLRFLWYQFVENEAIRKLIAQAAVNDPGEKQALARRAATLKNGGVLGIGPAESITTLTAGSGQSFQDAITYCDHEMAESVLAGFLNLVTGHSGASYALSTDQTEMFLQSRQFALREMAATFTGYVTADLVRYNFGPKAAVPTLEFSNLNKNDTTQTVTLLQSLLQADGGPARVPAVFVDELVEKVATLLDLNPDAVAKVITVEQEQSPNTTLGQIAAATDAATTLVKQMRPELAAVPG